MSWKDRLRGDSISWLLETDEYQPAVRYFTLRDILGHGEDEAEVKEARATIMSSGPVPVILANQEPEGYWCQPGPGYGPKYRSTVWQVIFLAQLGADGNDPKVKAGGEYILSNTVAKHGGFAIYGTPSSFVHCLAGNMGAALLDLGWLYDPRLMAALEWQARSITGERVAPLTSKNEVGRYYASNPGPGFTCGANDGLPCAWGAVKAMLALSKVPPSARTQTVRSAIEQGAEFLLSHDPAIADYPFGYGNRPSSSWFKFGYPIGYVTDVLQNLEALAALGKAQDERLTSALEMVEEKQDAQGRWKMEYTYNGKTWVDIETKGQPSKWVTLRAIRVLKAAYPG
ncbi:MAG: nitrogen fixation protein NifH [Dehalococcoidales bacterium]|nr:MAG: nitrogen fixation protein NifH [Dehalococcoidales bacterium]